MGGGEHIPLTATLRQPCRIGAPKNIDAVYTRAKELLKQVVGAIILQSGPVAKGLSIVFNAEAMETLAQGAAPGEARALVGEDVCFSIHHEIGQFFEALPVLMYNQHWQLHLRELPGAKHPAPKLAMRFELFAEGEHFEFDVGLEYTTQTPVTLGVDIPSPRFERKFQPYIVLPDGSKVKNISKVTTNSKGGRTSTYDQRGDDNVQFNCYGSDSDVEDDNRSGGGDCTPASSTYCPSASSHPASASASQNPSRTYTSGGHTFSHSGSGPMNVNSGSGNQTNIHQNGGNGSQIVFARPGEAMRFH